MTRKRICVLQVTPAEPNPDHVSFFDKQEDCDFYFVTHDEPHPDAMSFCPNTTWVETRNILASQVPKEYDYYAFIDYDFHFVPKRSLDVLPQILQDLEEFEPAVLTYYPGEGFISPYVNDEQYLNQTEYSIIPFTHCGAKIIHHSLMNWFFPMITKFDSGVDACHMFNFQELPFLRNVVCSHKMVYKNGVSDMETPHNVDGGWSKYRMDQMWEWFHPAFKNLDMLKKYGNKTNWKLTGDPRFRLDSLHPKEVFVSLFRNRMPAPERSAKNVDYYDFDRINKFYDTSHPFFANKALSIEQQEEVLGGDFKAEVHNILRKNISFDRLKVTQNPWFDITSEVNNKLENRRNITVEECVECYQTMPNNNAIFYKNSKPDPRLEEYLSGKRVALVGPAPYLIGKGRGKIIDDYDVVVRIQPEIFSPEDYGSRTDIIQSCMNSNYSPKIAKYLSEADPENYPKFIITNNSVARETYPGSAVWSDIVEEYNNVLKKYGVPFVHLKNDDGTFDRWALYWEVYAKKHIEKIGKIHTVYSANFNSGYGTYSMLLRHSLKELAVFGMDFYNFGKYTTIEQKYNPEYIKQQGQEGTYLGPDVMVHDIMAQAMHCKNILLQDERFKYDKEPLTTLLSDEMTNRINNFKKLPRLATHDTE